MGLAAAAGPAFPPSILLLGFMLLLTLACQASGWLEAIVAMATLTGAGAVLRLWRRDRVTAVARLPSATILASMPSLALFGLFTRRMLGAPTEYGMLPVDRLMAVLIGAPFATIGRATAMSSFAVTVLLVALTAAGLIVWLKRRPLRDAGEPLSAGLLLLPVGFLAFLMAVPDVAGGGWTHVWRAEPFPYIGLILVCAALPIRPWLRNVAIPVTAAAAMVAIVMIATVQVLNAPPVLREFNEVEG